MVFKAHFCRFVVSAGGRVAVADGFKGEPFLMWNPHSFTRAETYTRTKRFMSQPRGKEELFTLRISTVVRMVLFYLAPQPF